MTSSDFPGTLIGDKSRKKNSTLRFVSCDNLDTHAAYAQADDAAAPAPSEIAGPRGAALIRVAALASGDAWLREFIALTGHPRLHEALHVPAREPNRVSTSQSDRLSGPIWETVRPSQALDFFRAYCRQRAMRRFQSFAVT